MKQRIEEIYAMREMARIRGGTTGRKRSCNLAVRVGHLDSNISLCTNIHQTRNTNLQDAAREVVVVIDAAIALAALGHVAAIEARVRHGRRLRVAVVASGRTTEPRVGLLLLGPVKEESTTCKSSDTDHTNNHTSGNRSCVVAALSLCSAGIVTAGGGRLAVAVRGHSRRLSTCICSSSGTI